jgi:GNAT superfamily N-acetyltransferase
MHQSLSQAALKSGEVLEILLVEAPDEEYQGTVLSLLSHKGELRQWQFEEDFAGRGAGLRSRYYLGFIGGQAVANISVWESGVTGDLGHVYTVEQHRRKGVCRALMGAQMEDFRSRGGQFLVLGTGYDTPPYHIYKSFGFESMQPGSGSMSYLRAPAFFEEFFAPGEVECAPLEWRDLGTVCALMALPQGDWLRSKGARRFGPTCYEAAFVADMQGLRQGRLQARVARKGSGAVVACAVLRPDAEWGGQSWLLDLCAHPAFAGCAEEVLRGFAWPGEKVLCYLDADSPAREGLKEAGFVQEGRLAGLLRRGKAAIDVLVMGRKA